MVSLLKKLVYRLKQSFRQWYISFNIFMKMIGFIRLKVYNYVYIIRTPYHQVHAYILLYVNDMLIIRKDMAEINDIKGKLFNEFEMNDFGKASKIIVIQIIRKRNQRSLMLTQ